MASKLLLKPPWRLCCTSQHCIQFPRLAAAAVPMQVRHCRTEAKTIHSGPWKFELQVMDGSLQVEYELPEKLSSPTEAVDSFFSAVAEEVAAGASSSLAGSRDASANAVFALQFLDDVKRKVLQLIEEESVMEAVVLMTQRYALLRQVEKEDQKKGVEQVMQLQAARNFHDRAPAFLAIVAGLLGPIAWLPAALLLNEVLMRRVDRYKALNYSASAYSGRFLGIAAAKHHMIRPLVDVPRLVVLNDVYSLDPELTEDDLKETIASRSHRRYVTGDLTL
mmetsp:Transcript_68386/g.164134  ORF Transcript_68386/g.164134 Transcript_68386/m.164134 type:complete len:278 (+) Transcript_68386:59-892(+)|eukprot:CAMPEP_0178437284 /NCGR_PEP_ID=MMETSP0689_2-20121128/34902_1 /TAXON_ID=160604 /ORGANISM="Amphidinium massartii, Strain CS-259" /LENGTH=277 /DNA_ID=CAMNT_0020059459 /DNA_START=60 /DNA_END=893 /DNA_ORIENTATION=+